MSSANILADAELVDNSGTTPSCRRLRAQGVLTGRNSLVMVMAQGGGKIAGLILFVVLVRTLTIASLGQFTYALTFVGILTLITDWGISTWMARQIASRRDEASRWFNAAVCAKALTFVAAASLALVTTAMTGRDREVQRVIIILLGSMFADSVGQTAAYVFLALERGAIAALVTGTTDWLRLACVWLILAYAPDITHVAYAYCFASAAPLCAWSIFLLANGLRAHRPSAADLKTVLRCGIPFLLLGVFVRVYLRVDTLLLEHLNNDASVGTYNASYKLMESLLFIPAAFMGVIFPFLARTYRSDICQFRGACRISVRVLGSLGLPIAVGTTVIAPQLIQRLYGPDYAVSVLYLRILIWTSALIFVNAILPASLNAIGKEKYTLAVVGVGIVVNVSGNVILIPSLGATGAAIMTVLTEAISTLLYLTLFRRCLFALGTVGLIWRPLVAALLMGAIICSLTSWSLGALIMFAAATYTVCLVLLGGLRREDVDLGLAVLGVKR